MRRLLEGLRAGWWAGSDDVEGMRSLFIDAAARGDALQAAFQPDAAKVAQFERKVLAERYAQLLYDLAGKGCEADSPARAAGAEA